MHACMHAELLEQQQGSPDTRQSIDSLFEIYKAWDAMLLLQVVQVPAAVRVGVGDD
jgi:hypothetical protein